MVGKQIYYSSLDSLRGLAAMLIILFHTNDVIFKPFWIGVPIFFVLSGFLITRILLGSKESENYYKVFYIRRSLRIFPIYYLTLLFITVFSLYSHLDISQIIYYLLYFQSFIISFNLQPTFADGLMLHTWSLSVEELFYLFWPFFVLKIEKKKLLMFTKVGILIIILFKLSYPFIFYSKNVESEILLSLLGNLDSLLLGALLALIINNGVFHISKNKLLLFLMPLSLIIIFNYIHFSNIMISIIFKILLSIITSLFTYVHISYLLLNNNNKTAISYILHNKLLVYLGNISYGLYLYHFIVYRLFDAFVFHFSFHFCYEVILLLKIIITIIIAIISWHFFEKPILKYKNQISY